MPFLVAAVVFVGLLCLFNLVLMLGMLRRLRELASSGGGGHPTLLPYDPNVLIGRGLPEDLIGAGFVGFFDVGCDSCHEKAPRFAAEARGQVALEVVTGDVGKAEALAEQLSGVAQVLTGAAADRVVNGVGVQAFPMFLRTDAGGRVVAADTDLDDLAAAPQAV
ncbi:hypothetical protein [Nonomuraea longicatena]|uniref:Thioredoxin domain-containing protein n=1 Tax=Nonomuraea longicatena TaxID=83682 RepID=A0ABN1NP24_9ACTN